MDALQLPAGYELPLQGSSRQRRVRVPRDLRRPRDDGCAHAHGSDGLADLNLAYSTGSTPFSTKYVLMETADCAGSSTSPGSAGDYIVAVDPEHETIVWYLDLEAMTGLRNAATSGWRYQAYPTKASDRILVTLSHRYLFEWTFDGRELASYDFAPGGECDGARTDRA